MKKLLLTLLLFLFLINISIPAFAVDNGGIAAGAPDVGSETAVLLDADTGQVLYQKDMDKQMYPASITKIMTGMLALEKGKLNDTLTMSGDAVDAVDQEDDANIALSKDEQISLEQALYAISIASANDAANGIAENIAGSLDGFAAMMNEAALDAGATNTHFTNANGLPDKNHYTTAHDMALITAKALGVPEFIDIFGAKRYTIPPTNKQPETRIVNSSNRFLNGAINYDGILISKAGWTQDAQHTLVTAARRDGVTLVAVVMKATDSMVKWNDTKALFDYGFAQFTRVTVTREDILGAVPATLTLPDDIAGEMDPDSYVAQDVSLLLPKGSTPDDIQFTFGVPQAEAGGSRVSIPVSLSLKTAEVTGEASPLLETTVRTALRSAVAAPAMNAAGSSESTGKVSFWKVVLIACAILVAFVLVLFLLLLIRRAVILRKRRQRKHRSGYHHHRSHHRRY